MRFLASTTIAAAAVADKYGASGHGLGLVWSQGLVATKQRHAARTALRCTVLTTGPPRLLLPRARASPTLTGHGERAVRHGRKAGDNVFLANYRNFVPRVPHFSFFFSSRFLSRALLAVLSVRRASMPTAALQRGVARIALCGLWLAHAAAFSSVPGMRRGTSAQAAATRRTA